VVKANHKNAVKTNRPRSQPVQVSSDSVKFAKLAHYIKDVFCNDMKPTNPLPITQESKVVLWLTERAAGGDTGGDRQSPRGQLQRCRQRHRLSAPQRLARTGDDLGEENICLCRRGKGRTPPAPAAALIGLERPIISKRSRALVWRFGWLVNHVKATSAAGSSFLSKRGILNRLAFKGGTCLRTMLSAARDNFRPSWISRESRSGP